MDYLSHAYQSIGHLSEFSRAPFSLFMCALLCDLLGGLAYLVFSLLRRL